MTHRSAALRRNVHRPASRVALVALVTTLANPALAVGPEVAPQGSSVFPLEEVLVQSSFRPNPDVLPEVADEIAATTQWTLEVPQRPLTATVQAGEIVVIEGDSDTVTSFGNGRYGLRLDDQVQDPMTVVRRFYDAYPDDFEFIVVWTTFWDYGAAGQAYYVGIRQTTGGIGQYAFDNGQMWGSRLGGKLEGFLNMKAISVYGNVANTNNQVYPVMGQELTHRYLAYMSYQNSAGQASEDMLGRDDAHWSTLLQTDASVQDGYQWRDNNNGTFTALASNKGFSMLDLYALGVVGPDEVEPWYLIRNATYDGEQYNGLTQWPIGVTIQGTREDIGIDQVIAAQGPRNPDHLTEKKEHRLAIILVTRPGETAADVQDDLAQIETFRTTWEKKYEAWTLGRARLCTRTTAACDRPSLRIADVSVTELAGDGDGMPEPREVVSVSITVENPGVQDAIDVGATLSLSAGLDITPNAFRIEVGDVPAEGEVVIENAWELILGDDAPCGRELSLPLEVSNSELTAVGEVRFPLGFLDIATDSFEQDLGWRVNPEGTDTATRGRWERSTPAGVNAGNIGVNLTTQPNGGHDDGGRAFVTGPLGGQLGDHDVDEGLTTVVSPRFDLSDHQDPIISYWSWHVGLEINFQQQYIRADDGDALLVHASIDGGETWVLVESDTSNEQQWVYKEFRVLDLFEAPPASLQLRFTAQDAEPQTLSEAAFDDFRIWDLQPSCYGIFGDPDPDPGTIEPGDPGDGDPGDGNPGDGNPGDGNPGDGDPPIDLGTPDDVDGLQLGREPMGRIVGVRDSGCGAGDTGSDAPEGILALLALLAICRRRR